MSEKSKKRRTRPELIEKISQLEIAQTALRRSQDELKRSEGRYRELTEMIPLCVFEMDLQGKFTFANQYGLELFGFQTEDLKRGVPVIELIVEEDRVRAMATVARVVRGEPASLTEYTAQHRDGSRFPVLVLSGVMEREGEPVGVRGILMDISERKEAERKLARRADELERANRELARLHIAKDEFMAAVSHQLRTPLVTGLGYVDLLLEGSLGEVSQVVTGAMQIARRNLRRLSTLVDDILSYHSLLREDLRDTPSPEEFDLVQLCRESVAEVVIRTGKSIGAVRVDAPAGLRRVWADPEMIRRVLSNLLDNALRHAGADARPRIEIQRVIGGELEVTVRDSGCGIPRTIREQVFEPFAKERSDSEGAGLGLAIVRSILEAHGQVVALESDEGKGTCVVFRLPEAGTAGGPPAGERADGAAGRILVLEDDRDTADFLRLALSSKGYRVRTARTGDEALALLEAEPAELIFVDLQLPGMSGDEFCRRVRARPASASTPLYLMTGRSEGAVRARAEAAGCDGYVIKPIGLDDLLELIRNAIGG